MFYRRVMISTEDGSTLQTGSSVLITGGTGGIGLQSAVGIARTGARVIVTGRSRERAEAARRHIAQAANNPRVEFVLGDLASIAGIDALAGALLERLDRLDVLVNNAGYLGNEATHSKDGLEMHFAVNVLAPWRLSHALLPSLRAAGQARVLNVTGGDKPAAIDADNLQAEKGFRGLMTYTHAKSIMEAMSLCLAERFEPEGVSVNLVFPGRASTAMTRSLSSKGLPGPMKLMLPFFRLFFKEDGGKSAAKAAESTIWTASALDLNGMTGRYFDTHKREQQLHPTAYDPTVQAKILSLLASASGT
jgi:NAD(P)-dependent dehydrogenase (short-subunit alcohol dehydrogenase family)